MSLSTISNRTLASSSSATNALTRTAGVALLRRAGNARIARPSGVHGQLQARRNFLTIIEQGHEGWRLTLGRNPVPLKPGLRVAVPMVHTIMNIDMRESSISIPNLPAYTADNVPITCSGSLFYRVVDSYKSCFDVSNVHENVKNTGTSAVRSVIGHFTYDQVIADRNELNKRLDQVIGDSIKNWGVECTRFEIQNFQPANREVERQLELQMEAERNRRKQILDTQAHINVAEGQKQRVILESEGHLQAKANEADASYKTVFREAEARKQQSLMEASALAQQVSEVAKALAGGKDSTADDRKQALAALIELRRLEQLRAIATSQSNSTYFFGDKSSLGVANDPFNIDYAQHVKSAVDKKPAERRVDVGATVA
ncbi:stomatin family protein [Coprinopsis marcescibilis]|uniref:Stomatin family protein n=1 Tax=Coprinopsis marcescibilis TaxID=230819 RepID=A0A5C3L5C8_COPMA|nr:stomatin family protein [Coprinopsis marcescibilis]